MNKQNLVVPAASFIAMLVDDNDEAFRRLQVNGAIISGSVRIDGRKVSVESVHFTNLTFLESVTVDHFRRLTFGVINANFRSGIAFHECSGGWLSFEGCQMSHLGGYHNQFEVFLLESIEGEPADQVEQTQHPLIDISGFTVTEKFGLTRVQARELLTISSRVSGHFTASAAVVDDPVWALQLRLIGVPVHISTEIARSMLLEGSGGQRLAQVA